VNRTGTDGVGLDCLKISQTINPNVDQIDATYSDEKIEVFNIKPDFFSEYRKAFSTAQDRKNVPYKSIL